MNSLKPYGARSKNTQQPPVLVKPARAQLSAVWFSPFTFAYVTVAARSPNSWRTPTLNCFDLGTFAWLSINHASGSPVVLARLFSVALLAVRYAGSHAAYPAAGVVPGGANLIV